MAQIIVMTDDGQEHPVNIRSGSSLMEVIRDAGIDDLLALCGGCLSCATCHVVIDQDFVGQLPDLSPDEDDLLSSSERRVAHSRLSCQIVLSDAFDGMRVTIVPDD